MKHLLALLTLFFAFNSMEASVTYNQNTGTYTVDINGHALENPAPVNAVDSTLKIYLQEKIDEISLDMCHMLAENKENEDRWVFMDGQLNAYYDVLYRLSND